MNLSELLDRIESKMQRLVQKLQRLEREHAALAGENQRLKEEIAQKETFIAVLKDALAKTPGDIRTSSSEEPRKTNQPEVQLDPYARKIDQSIDCLNTN